MTEDQVMALAERLAAAGEQLGPPAPDPVNVPMVRHWTQAMGDANPIYLSEEAARAAGHPGLVAPPAMAQVWTMRGLETGDEPGGAAELLALLDEHGFTGVVATNCEHTYDRYLRPGDHVRTSVRMGEVTGPKRTAMGEGYFVTWHNTWYVGEERVAAMLFRVLKFRPGDGAAPGRTQEPGRYPLRPSMNQDTAFFWEGAAAGELRIQRCAECGRLRHPPGPMCPHCLATDWDYRLAEGRGEIESFVVHHHPPIPGRAVPFAVAVVALPEGVRVTGNVLGVAHDRIEIGMPVEVTYERVDDDLVLPQWRPAGAPPPLDIPLDRSRVVATALATRDFTPVHHDPDVARAQGSQDVFLNILTSMGLVQRYVTDWTGPAARVHAIALRLGAPAYAGDTLTLTGAVTDRDGDELTVGVRGRDSLGDHVTATVRIGTGGRS